MPTTQDEIHLYEYPLGPRPFIDYFFVQSYSHLAYLDYGGALFYPDPVCRPARKVGLD